MTADRTNLSRELYTLRALAEHSRECLSSKYIVQLLDDFFHEGPNGIHQCLVFELLGPTINVMADYNEKEERLDTEDILQISMQLLQAVVFMHEAGYAHGDLNIRNLVFNSSRLSHVSEEELFEILGVPELEDISRLDGEPLGNSVPNQLVKSVIWIGWPDEYDEEDGNIRVIDLGEAFHRDLVPNRIAQPLEMQAPETIFADKFDYRLDLWRAGLIIYYLLFGSLPYYFGLTKESFVASMIDFVGELPTEWQPQWEHMKRDAGSANKIREIPHPLGSELQRIFDKEIHEPELKSFLPVIQGLTRFLPSDRISASQALDLIRKISDNFQGSDTSDNSSDM